MLWVRAPQTASGFSFTTTDWTSALAPSFAVSVEGNPADSQ